MKLSAFLHISETARAPGKHFRLDDAGVLQSDVEGRLTRSLVRTVTRDLDTLASSLAVRCPQVHLAAGIANYSKAVAVQTFQLDRHGAGSIEPESGLPRIARNDACIRFAAAPGLLVIDCDGDYDHTTDIMNANPVLADYSFVETSSSSSCISGDDGKEYRGVKGKHLYFHILDATDIPRTLQTLHNRMLLAGLERHKISANGRFLERSSIDLALRVPSQPIYIHAALSDGLTQNKQVELRSGIEVLDSRAVLPDLTESERVVLAEMLAASRIRLKPECQKVEGGWIDNRVDAAVALGVKPEVARRQVVATLENGDLYPSSVINIGGVNVTVEEILRSPANYHNKACRDPLEPEYGSGSVAKIYTLQHQPVVHSYAHGFSRIYKMHGLHEGQKNKGIFQ